MRRRHRDDDLGGALDAGQIQAGQVPQPGVLDGPSIDRAARLHQHLDGVFAADRSSSAPDVRWSGSSHRDVTHDVDETDNRHGQADRRQA